MKINEIIKKPSLVELANKFRNHLEQYYDGEFCPIGECLSAAKELAEFLKKHGYPNAKAIGGYYKNVEDEYLNKVKLDSDDDLSDWNNTWKHWWVQVGDKIVDVTADQFHPSDPNLYKVIVTNINDSNYS